MVSQNLDYILRQAKTLTLQEREQFIELLRNEPAPPESVSTEEQLAAELQKNGYMLTIPPKPTAEDLARFNAWKPVPIKGQPLSETIIEERR